MKMQLTRAITLAPDIPEINLAKGNYFDSIKNDLNAAMKETEIANIKRPNDADILYQLSMLTAIMVTTEGALKIAEKVHELDPKGILGANHTSWQCIFTWQIQ